MDPISAWMGTPVPISMNAGAVPMPLPAGALCKLAQKNDGRNCRDRRISSSFPILALSGSLEGCDEPNCVCLDTSNTKRNHIVNGTVDSVSEYVKGIYSVYSVVCSNVLYRIGSLVP